MRKLWILIMVMLAFTALYYLAIALSKPTQPQVIVVKPSGAQTQAQTATPPQAEPQPPPQNPAPMYGPFACTKAVYLKVGGTSLCADTVYSLAKANDALQVDFQGGIVQGIFTVVSAPCTISTTPQGVFIPCRAQIVIPIQR
jgi:hypothetical protein